jgi:hypothetical protein
MLLARGSLQRLKIGLELDALRASLRWPRVAEAILASPQGRSASIGLLLLLVGRGRLARLVRVVAGALALVKLAGALSRLPRAPSPQSPEPPPSER